MTKATSTHKHGPTGAGADRLADGDAPDLDALKRGARVESGPSATHPLLAVDRFASEPLPVPHSAERAPCG